MAAGPGAPEAGSKPLFLVSLDFRHFRSKVFLIGNIYLPYIGPYLLPYLINIPFYIYIYMYILNIQYYFIDMSFYIISY